MQALQRVILSIGLLTFSGWLYGDINDVRLWHAPDHSRLVFDFSTSPEYKIFTLPSPPRLVIDFKNTAKFNEFDNLDVSVGPVRKIRAGVQKGKDLRVVLDLKGQTEFKDFKLEPNDTYSHRLVVDLFQDELARVIEPFLSDDFKNQHQRDIIIAIDAGHGGEDPGALGPGRYPEKKVVLGIAKKLASMLKKEPGFTPFLVRTGDYYIEHRKRTQLARKANADLFISIHADAFRTPQASGASVYALSERGATSETARWLADRENAADLIGGVGSVSLGDKDEMLAGVLLDLSMSASLQNSLQVGERVLANMGRVAKLHKRRVEQANFLVLKAPDVPSILVETGFISNPGEARRLKKSSYQHSIAQSIFRGVKQYFSESPPPGTWLAANQSTSFAQRTYVILPGDTLSQIAEENKTTTLALRKLNGLKNDKIRVGQVIQIPTS